MTIPVYCLLLAWLHIAWLPLQKHSGGEAFLPSSLVNSLVPGSSKDAVTSLYERLELERMGLSKQAFEYAYKGYRRLLKKNLISKQEYLTICDFSQSSNSKRLYLIDIESSEVLLNTYVAHGRNSGGEYASRFSNKPRSLQSSLGFYITENTYYGEHGLSLKVKGLEPGYNDKATRRRIVVHGADYIGDGWLEQNKYMGRSYGCPAIPRKESHSLINTIKNGSCLFIYHPSGNYLKRSKILNA